MTFNTGSTYLPYSLVQKCVKVFAATTCGSVGRLGLSNATITRPKAGHELLYTPIKNPWALMSFFYCASLNIVFLRSSIFLAYKRLVSHDYGNSFSEFDRLCWHSFVGRQSGCPSTFSTIIKKLFVLFLL